VLDRLGLAHPESRQNGSMQPRAGRVEFSITRHFAFSRAWPIHVQHREYGEALWLRRMMLFGRPPIDAVLQKSSIPSKTEADSVSRILFCPETGATLPHRQTQRRSFSGEALWASSDTLRSRSPTSKRQRHSTKACSISARLQGRSPDRQRHLAVRRHHESDAAAPRRHQGWQGRSRLGRAAPLRLRGR
jgi:hypothetical protein